MDTAKVSCSECSFSCRASIPMALGTPTVDTVMWRAPIPRSALMNRAAAVTARRLRRGSPIPMKTARQMWRGLVSTLLLIKHMHIKHMDMRVLILGRGMTL